jgi:ABC-type transport system involved in cytochrome bd biosynthesis fused ATPase/permease subunit
LFQDSICQNIKLADAALSAEAALKRLMEDVQVARRVTRQVIEISPKLVAK